MDEWIQINGQASVHPTVLFGNHCTVWAFTTIGAQVRIGSRCVIGSNCYLGRGSILGDEVHLNHGVFLPNGSRLGDRVFIGPNVTCTDDKHPRVNNPDYHAQPPILEDDVSVGAGAVLLPGIRLGQGCTIGAGAVVTKDVPAGETWAGNPARRLPRWPEPPADGGWMARAARHERENLGELIHQAWYGKTRQQSSDERSGGHWG